MSIERKEHHDKTEYLLIDCKDYIVELGGNYIVYRFGNEDKRMSFNVTLFPVIENTWNDKSLSENDIYFISIKMKGMSAAIGLELTYWFPGNYVSMFDFLAKGLGLFLQAGELLSKK